MTSSLKSTFKYFFMFHSGATIVALFYLLSGITLADIHISLKERFNIDEEDAWNFNTMIYVYIDYMIWTFSSLSVATLFKKNHVSQKSVLISSLIGAVLSVLFLVSHSINHFFDEIKLDTSYYWLFLASSLALFTGFLKPDRFHLTQRFVHFKAFVLFFFLLFIHANYIFNGVYPLSEKSLKDHENIAYDLIHLSESMDIDDYIVFSENALSIQSSIIKWESSSDFPDVSNETKDVFIYFDNNEDFVKSWTYVNLDEHKSNPKVIIETAARKNGNNILIKSVIKGEVSGSIYPQFYSMIYVSVAAFILIWMFILCFILVKHKNIGRK